MTKFQLLRQAWSEFWGRYSAIWRAVWAERKQLDSLYTAQEAQFLPAAQALSETPVSPAPRVVQWVLIAFAACALLWAIFGKMDIVALATGKIVPNARTKMIQPAEDTTITAIHVSDGQSVKRGQVLIELDATASAADRQRLGNDLTMARLQSARAQAMLTAFDTSMPPALRARAAQESEAAYSEAQALLVGQYADYRARLAQWNAELNQRIAQRQAMAETVKKLELTLPFVTQRAEDFKNLVEKKFISKHGYYDREQIRIEQQADLATSRSRLKELSAAVQQAEAQRDGLMAEARKLHLESLNEGQQKEIALSQELLKAEQRLRQTRLEAPVDGTVQQLSVHTVGGVVKLAQPLMMVVPSDNPLEIEAFVDNKDIGFITPGQEAVVKIETFQYTRYGTIPAHVISVSNDAISDEKRGLIYSTRVKLQRTWIEVDGKKVSLTPGMAATVEVKTGTRRVIEYFLSPLMEYGSESLRER